MNAPDRLEWLRRRQSGIGGSDVAAVLGISPWKTPLDIYNSKTTEPDDSEMSEAAYWGTVLEDVVAREYGTRTGAKVQRVNALLRHPEHDWAVANIDRAIVQPGSVARVGKDGLLAGTLGLLECKTASAYKASDWGREGDDEAVPVHYAAQAMWYLAVTGAQWCDFAVLIGGQRFVTKRVERDEETIRILIDKCRAFWVDHVQARVPPAPINTADVVRLFSKDDGSALEADNNAAVLAAHNEARALRAQIEEADKKLEQCIETLKLAMGPASAITLNGKPLITWKKAADSRKTDWKAVAAAANAPADLIEQHTTEVTGSRRFLFAKS